MISEAFMSIGDAILRTLPIVTLPDGMCSSLSFLRNVVGYANVFLPLSGLLPIIAMIVLVRRFNVVMSIINWVIRLIPFIG